jgi:hypothetical protein
MNVFHLAQSFPDRERAAMEQWPVSVDQYAAYRKKLIGFTLFPQ